jgi:hypothetical protein
VPLIQKEKEKMRRGAQKAINGSTTGLKFIS